MPSMPVATSRKTLFELQHIPLFHKKQCFVLMHFRNGGARIAARMHWPMFHKRMTSKNVIGHSK